MTGMGVPAINEVWFQM